MPFTLTQQVIAHADNLLARHRRVYTIDLTLYLPPATSANAQCSQLKKLLDWVKGSASQYHLVGYAVCHLAHHPEGGRLRGIVYLLPCADSALWYAGLVTHLQQHLPEAGLLSTTEQPETVYVGYSHEVVRLHTRLSAWTQQADHIPADQRLWCLSPERLMQ
ncbi:hypothetical protein [Aeromonas jandaei]|uniref:hypothetical protein n=1 Tax=Aeromonas jandaei TaxID=650 RepID=UPI001ADD951E|nr:hypothetical protein [Aeromonas jandaei]QTL93841.1 hypothetical protein AjGTCBM29_01696 [Aeromonas jandaei]